MNRMEYAMSGNSAVQASRVHVARRRVVMTRACGGFTLIELLVVVSIISLLVSILLPALSKARDAACQAVCSVNHRSIGSACHTFATENNGNFPEAFVSCSFEVVETGTMTSGNQIAIHLLVGGGYVDKESGIWRCPGDKEPIVVTATTDMYPSYTPPFGVYSYQWNRWLGDRREPMGTIPSDYVIRPFNMDKDHGGATIPVCRDRQWKHETYPAAYMEFNGNDPYIYDYGDNHKNRGFNLLLVDGHVDWVTFSDVDDYHWGGPLQSHSANGITYYDWN